MTEARIIEQLNRLLPSQCVLSSDEELRPYECDGLSAYRNLPLAVVIPENIDQVQDTLRLCAANQVPVVARGSGTGLSGGALPVSNGVLLSMARFNRILDIDVQNRTARVQPGVTNLSISRAAEPHGLYYAPDPSSQLACSIGGNVAENAGGVHCLKYGLTVHNILQLEVLTIDGEQLTIGSQALDSPGYDLLALMTGSEGLLGIITEVTVKLLPTPEDAQVILAAFNSVEAAGAAVTAVIASGIIPAGLELLDNPAIQAVEQFVQAGYPRDAAAILLCEVDGSTADVEAQAGRVNAVFRDAGATAIKVSHNDAERQRFWAGRKAAFPAMGRLSPDYYCMDGTIPRKHLAQVLNGIAELSEEYALPICNVFHAGDGNLHPLILYDANTPGELERTEELGGRILELCVAVGGTITGEHGVGLEKINQMCVQFNSGELSQFHAVKHAFDPRELLNPGKAIPTLHRCAEFGAMHVHHGRLPHPELERF
jgi:glycolate oxidase